MQRQVAENIAMLSRARKHLDALIKRIDQRGSAEIKVGGTGVVLPCSRGDALYTLLQSVRMQAIHKLNEIEIVKGMSIVAPYGASDADDKRSVCEECGGEYVKHYGRQKYCCKECAFKAGVRKSAERSKRSRRSAKP